MHGYMHRVYFGASTKVTPTTVKNIAIGAISHKLKYQAASPHAYMLLGLAGPISESALISWHDTVYHQPRLYRALWRPTTRAQSCVYSKSVYMPTCRYALEAWPDGMETPAL